MGLKARSAGATRNAAKTQATTKSVQAFLRAVPHERRRRDAFALLDLFAEVSGEEPVLWGDKIVGFGTYNYRYDSGRTGQWPRTGFSPGKAHCSVYIMSGFAGHEELLARLGPHTHAVSCLYLRDLEQIDLTVLRELVATSLEVMNERYPV